MTEKLFHEKFTIWRSNRCAFCHTKKGAIDTLLITVVLSLLLIIPTFRFLVSVFSTMHNIDKVKEVLEIASISTYTMLNQESLGTGILEIDEELADQIFHQQVDELTAEDYFLQSMLSIEISITGSDSVINIESSATIMSAFDNRILVENSLEFIIDPIMEG